MRVKVLLALAIASVLLFCSLGVAAASTDLAASIIPAASILPASFAGVNGITGLPTAADLTAAANAEIAAFGFPDLSAVDSAAVDQLAAAESVDAFTLDTPLCGVCGSIPDCTCGDTLTTIPGPAVNLGCPLLTVTSFPVNLVSPKISPVFPTINLAPQYSLALPQVNTQLNCFDIACQPCTSINTCPVVDC